jgi:hypothetical protein
MVGDHMGIPRTVVFPPLVGVALFLGRYHSLSLLLRVRQILFCQAIDELDSSLIPII